MPCRDYPSDDQWEASQQRDRADKLARMLCTLCGQLESARIWNDYGSTEIHEWWKEHKEQDRKRLAAEAKRQAEEHDLKMREYKRLKKELGIL